MLCVLMTRPAAPPVPDGFRGKAGASGVQDVLEWDVEGGAPLSRLLRRRPASEIVLAECRCADGYAFLLKRMLRRQGGGVAVACDRGSGVAWLSAARLLALGLDGKPLRAVRFPRDLAGPGFVGARDSVFVEILARARWQGRAVETLDAPLRLFGSADWRVPRRIGDFVRLWRERNSFEAADYDARAFDSIVLPQRWWQRRRDRIIRAYLAQARATAVADVGCGSNLALRSIPHLVGVDLSPAKCRQQRRQGARAVAGDIGLLPLAAQCADTVICSEVIEHLPADTPWLAEIRRILRPGGYLILGTPDYGKLLWRVIEFVYGLLMPHGYADVHITHYTRRGLAESLDREGFRLIASDYVFGAELIALYRLER